MSGGSDIWGSVDAGTYSDLEDEDDDEDDELGPRISATIKYVELPAKYDAPRVKLVKLNEATCPGCITACRRSIALSTVSIIFLVVASFDAVLSVAVVRVRMLAWRCYSFLQSRCFTPRRFLVYLPCAGLCFTCGACMR